MECVLGKSKVLLLRDQSVTLREFARCFNDLEIVGKTDGATTGSALSSHSARARRVSDVTTRDEKGKAIAFPLFHFPGYLDTFTVPHEGIRRR